MSRLAEKRARASSNIQHLIDKYHSPPTPQYSPPAQSSPSAPPAGSPGKPPAGAPLYKDLPGSPLDSPSDQRALQLMGEAEKALETVNNLMGWLGVGKERQTGVSDSPGSKLLDGLNKSPVMSPGRTDYQEQRDRQPQFSGMADRLKDLFNQGIENYNRLRGMSNPDHPNRISPKFGIETERPSDDQEKQQGHTPWSVDEAHNIMETSKAFEPRSAYNPYAPSPKTHNGMPEGNCTWYAQGRMVELGANPKDLPMMGNASQWIDAAKKMGHKVTDVPKVGALVAWGPFKGIYNDLGHVGVVEKVYPDGSFDMSHSGWTIVARRGQRYAVDNVPAGSANWRDAKFIHVPLNSKITSAEGGLFGR